MRKRLAILLILLCLFAFPGCGNKEATREPPTPETQEYPLLVWPDCELAALLPRPASDHGEAVRATDTELFLLIADTSQEDYLNYTEACWSSGFSFQYRRSDENYYASTVDGYALSISLENDYLMRIALYAPRAETSGEDRAALETENLTDERVLSEQAEGSASSSTSADRCNYVLNTSTRKFHLPDCSSVKDIKDKNRMEYYGTREELIEEGYQPCKRCNP